ncbi:Protein kinase domain-containing protein ppk32 [Hypsizygus marmoreus]|uniref:Protein kinase domain-containing protein ppk32 n=1 Tax=Hypsizygus marmoreus TaxID=39966 RepID=A0A369JRC1_HYPMA|nr:Protein kinase domain-containing protein ppk32 [Hypsizygus marmoreus]
MLAAATSFFGRTAISQSYNIGSSSGSRPSTPGHATTSLNTSTPFPPSLNVGLWRVQPASHKVTNKRVSVWSFDKRGSETERLGASARERILEVLKAEASALSRLRHPSILEMVEPLEETRGELTFATEPILSSLELSIPGARRSSPLVELDEVEIQKGILQICKGLSFLHSSAQLIHSNLNLESIVLNGAGDWKISGLGLTIPLLGPGGAPSRWEFPTFDGRVPGYIQRSFDYMAPEYALDELLLTASDMYSLGCVIYSVHCKGRTPYKSLGSLGGLRENAGKSVQGMEGLDKELQDLLRSLITRHANTRPTPTTLSSHPFFSSLPISTLNFLDRSNFTSKTREEKISFMKGLTGVLDKFSDGLRTRKILPSLLEEMKDTHLLPYILPNVFSISTALSPVQFASAVLPSLKPLFSITEPPQNMLTLLDNLGMLQSKTDKNVFREHVLPLVYNALESEHAVVQERALKAVPDLCETIDYAEVQGVLFPRVAFVFTKTRILTVKVATLVTFLTMVKTLDQSSLTQKLVPLLSKIRTKEPAVMMATLSVQEAMGFKVDREAVATLVLPQLWSMSIGPLLNVEQFQRFMQVIKKLGDRVEKEHNQFLRDSQRLEDRSATTINGGAGPKSYVGSVDFESLVGRANGAIVKADAAVDVNKSWDDDVWSSIFNDNVQTSSTPPAAPSRPDLFQSQPSRLGAMPMSTTPLTPGTLTSSPSTRIPFSTGNSTPSRTGFAEMMASASPPAPPPIPNYNISLSTATSQTGSVPQLSTFSMPLAYTVPPPMQHPQSFKFSPLVASPPTTGRMLAPSKPLQPSWGTSTKKPSKDDWGDFDPLA